MSPERAAWEHFRTYVEWVSTLAVEPDNLRAYYRVADAYDELRGHYVTPRKKGRPGKGKKDPSLDRWPREVSKFRDVFWGLDEGGWVHEDGKKTWQSKRRFRGVLPEIRSVMEAWSAIRNAWQHHTPNGKRQRAASMRRLYATPEGKAQKLAYQASEAGLAARKRGAKETKRKRQVAKGAAQQALYDSWASEDAIEGALRDV